MSGPNGDSGGQGGLGITRPTRRRLHHTPPGWVKDGAVFFITVCCQERGRAQLDRASVFDAMVDAVEHYVAAERWWCGCFLAMPDHWHGLMSFPPAERMDAVLRDWKRYVAKQSGIVWQDGFFDHRLRSEEKAASVWTYISENPVRKGLCEKPENWPWVWHG